MRSCSAEEYQYLLLSPFQIIDNFKFSLFRNQEVPPTFFLYVAEMDKYKELLQTLKLKERKEKDTLSKFIYHLLHIWIYSNQYVYVPTVMFDGQVSYAGTNSYSGFDWGVRLRAYTILSRTFVILRTHQ